MTVKRSKREMKHARKKAESSKQSPVFSRVESGVGERLCSALAPKARNRQSWCPVVYDLADSRRDSEEGEAGRERAQNAFFSRLASLI